MEPSKSGQGKKKGKKCQTFQEEMASIDSWASSLAGNKNVASKATKTTGKCVFVNMDRDVESGSYKWKNPGKVYKRRKAANKQKNVPEQHQTVQSTVAAATPATALPDGQTDVNMEDNEDFTNSLSGTMNEVLNELENLQIEFPASKQETVWEARKRTLDENWSSIRQSLFQHSLMQNNIPNKNAICGECKLAEACIRCISCLKLLCTDCDNQIHSQLAFHDRQCWNDGFYKGLGNRFTIQQNELCEVVRPLPVFPPSPCPECKEGQQFLPQHTSSLITIVTPKGRFEFNETIFFCTNCSGTVSGSSHFLMVMSGYWPGSPQKAETFYSLDLLQLWDSISNHSPGTSMASFIKSLETVSRVSGRTGAINSTSFGRSYREWGYCQSALRTEKEQDMFSCPVCSSCCHSIHVDGHRKTYRFKKVPRGVERPFFEDQFIVNDDDVHQHMKKVYDEMGSQDYADDKMCGGSYWQAARAHSKKSFGSLDETGLVVAGCRHVIALKAVNMFAGEQYGYTLFLHNELSTTLKMQFLWLDIICKYWPWLEKVARKLPVMSSLLNTKSALSVLHAKVHSLDCQVVWGGTYQESAALSTGESMEQFFSYLAKCGLTTKNMNAAARIDTLTERTRFWNGRKIENLAKTLTNQYLKAQNKLARSLQEKRNLIADANREIDDTAIETWENELRKGALASLERSSSSVVTNQIEEYFRLSKAIETAKSLSIYSESTDKAGSIVIGQEDIFEMVAKRQKDITQKQKKLELLEKKLASETYSRTDLLRDGKAYVVGHTLELLRTRIVHLYLNLNQQNCEVSRLADTSKKRIKLRKAMSSTKVSLKSNVDKFNAVVKLSDSDTTELNIEDAFNGKFYWNEERVELDLPDWLKKRIVDKQIIIKRCREELTLCIKEMRAYCSFYKEKAISLQSEMKQIDDWITGMQSHDGTGSYASRDVMATTETSQESKRYCLTQNPSVGHLIGLKLLKLQGISTAKTRISEGILLFKGVLQNFEGNGNESFLSSDEEEEDDDADSEGEEREDIVEDSILM